MSTKTCGSFFYLVVAVCFAVLCGSSVFAAPEAPVTTPPREPATARPVGAELVQVYGWKEYVSLDGVQGKFKAKLDTGALTCSIHAEEKELFERDGRKWVRFVMVSIGKEKTTKSVVEAPLLRIAKVKETSGGSKSREVVMLSFRIGDRKMRGEFTLNNRSNMLFPILIGRNVLKELGWVDSTRTYLADQKILR